VSLLRCLLALGVALAVGCAFEHFSPKDADAAIPDRSEQIAVGRMDRAAVRGVLGTQPLSSEFWRFDLFRADTEQSQTVYAVTPWPMPFARFTDQLQRFTLVVYGGDGRVAAVTSAPATSCSSSIRKVHAT
jgi:hypothetical protein